MWVCILIGPLGFESGFLPQAPAQFCTAVHMMNGHSKEKRNRAYLLRFCHRGPLLINPYFHSAEQAAAGRLCGPLDSGTESWPWALRSSSPPPAPSSPLLPHHSELMLENVPTSAWVSIGTSNTLSQQRWLTFIIFLYEVSSVQRMLDVFPTALCERNKFIHCLQFSIVTKKHLRTRFF